MEGAQTVDRAGLRFVLEPWKIELLPESHTNLKPGAKIAGTKCVSFCCSYSRLLLPLSASVSSSSSSPPPPPPASSIFCFFCFFFFLLLLLSFFFFFFFVFFFLFFLLLLLLFLLLLLLILLLLRLLRLDHFLALKEVLCFTPLSNRPSKYQYQ